MGTTQTQQDLESLESIVVQSNVTGRIEELSHLHKSLLFAEISSIAYLPRSEVHSLGSRLGFNEIRFIDRDGAQAYLFENDEDIVAACRGTEPDEWNDIKADCDAVTALAETVGRVHRGFKQEVDDLWPRLEKVLVENTKTLWFTGHSLGGAMATICAGRCLLSHIKSNPKEVYTYGSPRVGNKRYVNYCDVNYTRWVNNNDIVTRVPPALFGYRHTGNEMYLNAFGKIRRVNGWQRTKDRWRGFFRGLRKGTIDHFADHSITRYIEYIYNAVKEQEEKDGQDFATDAESKHAPNKPR